MKKYCLILLLALWAGVSGVRAADFGDLLSRLDSRDFSAEKNVLSGVGGPYVGETQNPHAETVMFKARDEFSAKIAEARNDQALAGEISAFILGGLKSDVSVETKVWLLHQLPFVAAAKEVPVIAEYLKSDEQRLTDAAAMALAKISAPEALDALKAAGDIPAAKSALAQRTAPMPPYQPNETLMPLALAHAAPEQVEAFLKNYDGMSEVEKVQVLAGLTQRGDRKYRPMALAALNSDSAELKKAGLIAMEKLATKDDVDAILANLDAEHDLTVRICGFIVADGFDQALEERFAKLTDSKKFLDLATILIDRAVDIRAEVFRRTTAADCPDRLALLQKVAQIATVDDVPSMVFSAMGIPRGADHDAAENLVAALCRKDAAPIIALMPKFPPAVVYPVMCRTGGDAAKAELTRGLDSSDLALREAAVRSLALWADATMADKMSAMLDDAAFSDAQKIAILRAYIRVISLPDDKIGIKISRDEKLDALKKAFQRAKRVDEKKLILSRLAANRTVKSLAFAVECAEDPELAEAAYAAIADHAHDTALRKEHADAMVPAMDLVIEKSQNKELVDRVKIYKERK